MEAPSLGSLIRAQTVSDDSGFDIVNWTMEQMAGTEESTGLVVLKDAPLIYCVRWMGKKMEKSGYACAIKLSNGGALCNHKAVSCHSASFCVLFLTAEENFRPPEIAPKTRRLSLGLVSLFSVWSSKLGAQSQLQ